MLATYQVYGMLAEYFGSRGSGTKGAASQDEESGKHSLILAQIGFEVYFFHRFRVFSTTSG